ncbi:TraE/TraK family type IV conjugative transfer system protein, partial [Escherichia coli]
MATYGGQFTLTMSVLIVLSLSVNVIQGVNNYRLQNEQRTAVTPMAFNAPFAVS